MSQAPDLRDIIKTQRPKDDKLTESPQRASIQLSPWNTDTHSLQRDALPEAKHVFLTIRFIPKA